MDEKRHWFAYSYKGKTPEGQQAEASTYVGYTDKAITLKRINANKIDAGVTEDSVLIAVTYCGYMTKQEFIDND